jgi:hypothetical protein
MPIKVTVAQAIEQAPRAVAFAVDFEQGLELDGREPSSEPGSFVKLVAGAFVAPPAHGGVPRDRFPEALDVGTDGGPVLWLGGDMVA